MSETSSTIVLSEGFWDSIGSIAKGAAGKFKDAALAAAGSNYAQGSLDQRNVASNLLAQWYRYAGSHNRLPATPANVLAFIGARWGEDLADQIRAAMANQPASKERIEPTFDKPSAPEPEPDNAAPAENEPDPEVRAPLYARSPFGRGVQFLGHQMARGQNPTDVFALANDLIEMIKYAIKHHTTGTLVADKDFIIKTFAEWKKSPEIMEKYRNILPGLSQEMRKIDVYRVIEMTEYLVLNRITLREDLEAVYRDFFLYEANSGVMNRSQLYRLFWNLAPVLGDRGLVEPAKSHDKTSDPYSHGGGEFPAAQKLHRTHKNHAARKPMVLDKHVDLRVFDEQMLHAGLTKPEVANVLKIFKNSGSVVDFWSQVHRHYPDSNFIVKISTALHNTMSHHE